MTSLSEISNLRSLNGVSAVGGGVGITEAVQDILRAGDEGVGQLVDLDVAEGDDRLALAMDLQGDVAFERDVRGSLGVVHRAHAIDEELDALVLGTDFIGVPFAGLLGLFDQFLSRLGEHGFAA